MTTSTPLDSTSNNRSFQRVDGASSVKFIEIVVFPDGNAYSGYVPELPGVFGAGDSEIAAFADLKESLAGALKAYSNEGRDVPWREPSDEDRMDGERCEWVEWRG